jgi:hypothetical protein
VANDRGEVIGITVAKLMGGQSLNFAIPVNYARGELTLPVQEGLLLLAVSKPSDQMSANQSTIPRRWKSLTTGFTSNVQVSGDVMLVETELPTQAANVGAKLWSELKKDGDKWVGTTHRRFPCTRPFSAPKWCQVDTPMQITTLLSGKIEGVSWWTPPSAKFNCAKCEFDPALAPKEFTWIPAEP